MEESKERGGGHLVPLLMPPAQNTKPVSEILNDTSKNKSTLPPLSSLKQTQASDARARERQARETRLSTALQNARLRKEKTNDSQKGADERANAAAEKLQSTIRSLPGRLDVVSKALTVYARIQGFILQLAGVLLLLFVVHQLFIWVARDPDYAFSMVAQVLKYTAVVWDAFRVLVNALIDILNAAVIPLWNALSFYLVEPVLSLIVEVFSLVFMQKSFPGVIDEKDFPYGGFTCTKSESAAAWCGRFSYYDARLRGDPIIGNNSIVFGPATARRLSELTDDEDLVIPDIDLGDLTGALDGLTTQLVVAGASLGDAATGVVGKIVREVFQLILDAVWYILKALLDVLKVIVRSGLLSFFINIGVDFLIISTLYIGLPMILVLVDMLFCIINFFQADTWGEQFECIERRCFTGADVTGDILIFFSFPLAWQRYEDTMNAVLNSNTARKMTGGQSFDINFISGAFDNFPALNAGGCAECFTCKIPELRAVWLAIALSVSILSETNYNIFRGNVSDLCTDGGVWYEQACGPRGAETSLPYNEWSTLYTEGFSQFEPDLVEAYAAHMAKRSVQMGGCASTDGCDAKLTAETWTKRDTLLPLEVQAGRFTYRMCKLMRSSKTSEDLQQDFGPSFSTATPGSLGWISGSYLYGAHYAQSLITLSTPCVPFTALACSNHVEIRGMQAIQARSAP